MPDFPGAGYEIPPVISTAGSSSQIGQYIANTQRAFATAVWQATNTAIYVPVQIDVAVTVVKMAFRVGVQSGNYDIGIYDEHGNRIVSLGSTAVPVAGIATADIADTALMPGVYFLALCIDNVTASIFRATPPAVVKQGCGVQQQAVGAVTLPASATFANPSGTYLPLITAAVVTTI